MSNTFRVVVWCAAMSLASRVGFAVGQPANPYQAIAARNVFRLVEALAKPSQPVEPAAPRSLPRMVVTGLTDVCGRAQVLMEVGEGGNTVRRLILEAGESIQGVRVMEIDVRAGSVKVVFDGETTVLSLSRGAKQEVAATGPVNPGPSSLGTPQRPIPLRLKPGP